jgi:hypothetical protein
MKNEKPQINYTNFDFFNIDSLVPEPMTSGVDAYSNLLDESQNYVEEDNSQIISEAEDITLQIPETTVTNTLLPPLEDIDNSLPSTPENIDNSLPSTPENIDNSLPLTPRNIDNSLPLTPRNIDNSLPLTPRNIDNSLPLTPRNIDNSLPSTPEDVINILPTAENSDVLSVNDLLPPVENNEYEQSTTEELLPELIIENTDNVNTLQDFNLDAPGYENTIRTEDLITQEPVVQDEQVRIDELINESTEIIYNKKSSLDKKIETLEQNISSFQSMMNPQKGPIITPTQSIMKSRDTVININPGYADDLMTFFRKINGPPKWRAMTN